QSQDGETYFVKIHAPWDLLARYAEIMKLKKPIKKDDAEKKKSGFFSWLGVKDPFQYDHSRIPQEPTYFSTGFNRTHVDQFIIKDRESFFTPSQRSLIVWEILLRVRYNNNELGVGISRLLANGIYVAAFPLHDGRYDRDGPNGALSAVLGVGPITPTSTKSNPFMWVRRYVGDKMAMYFAWLGFYTEMLIPAAILGSFTFVCGSSSSSLTSTNPVRRFCKRESNSTGTILMCPQCDKHCDYSAAVRVLLQLTDRLPLRQPHHCLLLHRHVLLG
ncbi:hypothetical protein Pcinc_039359, partial [Petrolisthes cinctipes]